MSGTNQRVARFEERLAVPVVLAALSSVPAMFLTMLDGTAAAVGAVVNYASLGVLTAESVVLFALAGDRREWLREHWFVVVIAVAAVPAVLFAIGPVQVLRVIRVVGALRVIRVRRILRAGQILRRRAGLEGLRWRVAAAGLSAVAALFVTLILADPTSASRQLIDGTMTRFGLLPVLAAGLIVGASTIIVWSARGKTRGKDRSTAAMIRRWRSHTTTIDSEVSNGTEDREQRVRPGPAHP